MHAKKHKTADEFHDCWRFFVNFFGMRCKKNFLSKAWAYKSWYLRVHLRSKKKFFFPAFKKKSHGMTSFEIYGYNNATISFHLGTIFLNVIALVRNRAPIRALQKKLVRITRYYQSEIFTSYVSICLMSANYLLNS